MASARFEIFDPLLEASQADAMLRLCEAYGSYGSYAEEATNEVQFAPELPQRYDAAVHFVRTGGRFRRREEVAVLAARTNYFRETYAYDEPAIPGIESFLHHEGFIAAAQRIHDRPVIAPNIVYANLLVPGQELAVHTDVPEFRGANRKRFPQWLLVVMHHSGLFDGWRMPIATGIAYFGDCGDSRGGALAFYPDGPEREARTLPATHNTAVLLDTDSIFHGVDRVTESRPLPPLRPGMKLVFEAGSWRVRDGGEEIARYDWDELRFSVSWKAYCYADAEDQRRTEEHRDDLELDFILDRLCADLGARGRLGEGRPSDPELAVVLIEEYVRFPSEPEAPGGTPLRAAAVS